MIINLRNSHHKKKIVTMCGDECWSTVVIILQYIQVKPMLYTRD